MYKIKVLKIRVTKVYICINAILVGLSIIIVFVHPLSNSTNVNDNIFIKKMLTGLVSRPDGLS